VQACELLKGEGRVQACEMLKGEGGGCKRGQLISPMNLLLLDDLPQGCLH
jgi:hypothetical protein